MKIFSGIQPTGKLHIGNYFGAIQNMVKLQDENEAIFSIVDLHALTVPYDPKEMPQRIKDTLLDFLASGINPEKSIIFIQSHIKEHAELAYILSNIMPIGELQRMTQFKDKAQKEIVPQDNDPKMNEFRDKIAKDINIPFNEIFKPENKKRLDDEIMHLREKRSVNAGLLIYPVLMAADILLYDTDMVPVGDDQKQHLELTQDIVRRFNNRFGEIFKSPKVTIPQNGARIMSLSDPLRKMSKSEPNGCLFMTDSPEEIEKKIKAAVTDTERIINFDPEKRPALANLLTIYSLCEEKPIKELTLNFDGHAEFKKALTESLIKKFLPIREKRKELEQKPDYIKKVLEEGRAKAQILASKKMNQIKKAIGLL